MNSGRFSISVILPVRNAADHLEQQLEALSRQTYQGPWELLIADNGSSDGTRAIAEAWRDRIANMAVVDASRPGRGAACNIAVAVARGDVFVFCDGDDIVHPGWIAAYAAAAEGHDLVAGALDHVAHDGSPIPWKADAMRHPTVALNFKAFAMGANMAVSRNAFEAVGGFAEELQVCEDIDLSWRLQQSGFGLYFEPAAVVAKRGRRGLRDEWRQAALWGAGDVDLERRHRQSGLRRSSMLATIRYSLRRAADNPRLAASLLSYRHRRFWVAGIARRWGRLRRSLSQ
jgi:glycosyltransferase involved in cell wall biosynthesis